MPDDNTTLVQQSFGPNAEKYARSAAFAKGESLNRLLEVVNPQPGWIALDVATGGGHTALAVAKHVRQVIATDITLQMLLAAETMIRNSRLTSGKCSSPTPVCASHSPKSSAKRTSLATTASG